MTNTDKDYLFISIIEANKGIIYKVVISFCADPEDRKDLIQEIMLTLWRAYDSYNEEFKYSTWIYRISLNVAISFYRKERSRKKNNTPLSDSILTIADFQDNKQTEQNAVFLTQFISELKELDKALMLLYLDEKSHKEMAGIMGISETNVATKIGRIKMTLKQKFSQSKI